MKAFIGLVKKDLSLMKFWYIVWLVVFIIGMAGVYILSVYLSEPLIPVPFLMMAAGFHMFLAPISLLYTLNLEGKTQLWLYNPQSSLKLLLSKLSAAAIIQLIAQLIISLYALFIMQVLVKAGKIASFGNFLPIKQGIFMQLGIFSTAMYISIWFIFLWTVYHSLGKYPAIRHFRWLAVVLVWFAWSLLEGLLLKTKTLTNEWFSLDLSVRIEPNLKYEDGWNIIYTDVSLPIIPILLYAALAITFLLLASWLLDRKVEV